MNTKSARLQRTRREPAPPLFEVLDHTHRRILQALADLQQLVDRIERLGTDDAARSEARALRVFFNAHARQHHEDEESQVFPRLLDSGDNELVGHVRRLQQDHGWLEEDWIELGPQLRAVAEGYNWFDLDVLRHAIPVFAELYRDHIALEETVVYPASRSRQGAPAHAAARPH